MTNRIDTIIYAGIKAKQKRNEEFTILQCINALEQNLNHNDQAQTNQCYKLKNKWEYIETDKINGIILRSTAKFVEEDVKRIQNTFSIYKNALMKKTHESNF